MIAPSLSRFCRSTFLGLSTIASKLVAVRKDIWHIPLKDGFEEIPRRYATGPEIGSVSSTEKSWLGHIGSSSSVAGKAVAR